MSTKKTRKAKKPVTLDEALPIIDAARAAAGIGPVKRTAKPIPPGISREIARQQSAIYEAQAMTECVVLALEKHFNDWPREIPMFNFALKPVIAQLGAIATALYPDELSTAAAQPDSEGGEA